MIKTKKFYGKVKTKEGTRRFIFSLEVLFEFIKTQKFTELTITKRKPITKK